MKACPHCGGLIRPSVIKCVHCGMSLVEDGEAGGRGPTAAGRAPGGPDPGATVVASRTAGAGVAGAAPADPWVTPSARAEERVRRAMRAVGPPVPVASPRVRRIDAALLLAGLLAVAGAVAAASALSLPWVVGRLSAVGQHGTTREVAELTLHASDSVAHAIVLGAAVGVGTLGLLWFWYGLDRGVHLPVFAHPSLGVLGSVASLATVGASRLGPFLWQEAFVARARDAGLTKAAMRALLEDVDARTLAFEQQAGMTRLTAAAALILVAAVLGWWSQRDHG